MEPDAYKLLLDKIKLLETDLREIKSVMIQLTQTTGIIQARSERFSSLEDKIHDHEKRITELLSEKQTKEKNTGQFWRKVQAIAAVAAFCMPIFIGYLFYQLHESNIELSSIKKSYYSLKHE